MAINFETEAKNHDKKDYLFIKEVPEFVVDLDLPPSERWKEILPIFKKPLKKLVQEMKLQKKEQMIFEGLANMFGSIVGLVYGLNSSTEEEPVTKKFKTEISEITNIPPYLLEEIRGIASVTEKWGLDERELLMLNLGYDLLARCTSIVMEKPNSFLPFHLRVMDWDLDILRELTIHATFVSKGKEIMKSTTWVGFVGLLTVMKLPQLPDSGFSISINYRETKSGSLLHNFGMIFSLSTLSWPLAFLVRHVAENFDFYDEVVKSFAETPLIAPCYVIVAGVLPGQGTVITRNRTSEEKRLDLSQQPLSKNQIRFVIQTNCEHWKKKVSSTTSFLVQNSIYRCNQVRKSLEGFNWSKKKLVSQSFKTMDVHEVLSSETIYQTLMCPSTQFYTSRIVVPPNLLHSDQGESQEEEIQEIEEIQQEIKKQKNEKQEIKKEEIKKEEIKKQKNEKQEIKKEEIKEEEIKEEKIKEEKQKKKKKSKN